MKKIITVVLLLIAATVFVSDIAFAYRSTRSYSRKNGTYVAPHYSSSSNNSKADNWSAQGNVNPFTGKRGYKKWY